MSLSSALQTPEILALVAQRDPAALRRVILEQGARWFEQNPAENDLISHNLSAFGFTPAESLLSNVRSNILLHYYEKFLVLAHTPAHFRSYLVDRIDVGTSIDLLRSIFATGATPLIAVSHFGAVELIVPLLATVFPALSAALRFGTPRFAEAARESTRCSFESGAFGRVNLIEIGSEKTSAAMEMAAALRRREMVVTIFDEANRYSVPVNLLQTSVLGGAGLDRIKRFCGAPCTIIALFLRRTTNEHYELIANTIAANDQQPIQSLYNHLEELLKQQVEQWYLLHEEIAFVSGEHKPHG